MPSLRRSALLIALIGALGLLADACAGGASGGPGSSTGPEQPAMNAARAALLPSNAYALPDFDYTTYQQLLGQLGGTPVLVNIWASWCGPCKTEAPDLARAARAYGSRVQFLGIDVQDARSSAVGFMHTYGWTYPSVSDRDGAIRDRLGLIGQPVTLFYDARGTLVSTWQGPITPEELTARLDALVGPTSSA
jgi:thiol-disulfide isomerase/thioredoxin